MPETIAYTTELDDKEPGSTILSNSENGRVLLPAMPLVPPDGGVNLTVIPATEVEPYFSPDSDIKETLPSFLVALAAARAVIFEPNSEKVSRFSQWVNVHAIPRFGGEGHLQFEVTGKNAMNEKAWGMPVKYPKESSTIDEEYPGYSQWGNAARQIEGVDYSMYPVVAEEIGQIKSQIPDREEDVIREARDAVLFNEEAPEGIEHENKCMFTFRNFDIIVSRVNPHVKEGGIQLCVVETTHRKTEGVQSNVKNALEQFIISSAIAKSIFKAMGRKIEIHFSSNWGLPTHLQQDEAIAQGKDPGVSHIREILGAHANLYAAPLASDRVDLPERPIYSNPDVPEDTRDAVKLALEQNLLAYLQPFENKKYDSLNKE